MTHHVALALQVERDEHQPVRDKRRALPETPSTCRSIHSCIRMAVRADHQWQTHMAAAERQECSHWAEADSHGPDVPQGGRDLQREPAHDADLPHLMRPHCDDQQERDLGTDQIMLWPETPGVGGNPCTHKVRLGSMVRSCIACKTDPA